MARNVWHPPAFAPHVTLWAHILLFLAMITRGVDYAVGESELSSRRLGAVEIAAPLWVWGALFATAATVGFISMGARWVNGIILAHTLGTALYCSIGVGLLWDIWDKAPLTNFPYGWPSLFPVVTFSVVVAASLRYRDTYAKVLVLGAGIACLTAEVSVELDGLRNSVIIFTIAGLHAVMAAGNARARVQEELIMEQLE